VGRARAAPKFKFWNSANFTPGPRLLNSLPYRFMLIGGKCVRIDQGGAYARPASQLCVACVLPARLPCSPQAGPSRIRRSRIVPVAAPEWQACGRRAGVAHPWPRRSLSQARCSDRRENLRGKYGRKIVVDNNLLFSMKYTFKTRLAKLFILN